MSLLDLLGLTTRGTGECIIKIGGSEIDEYYPNLQSSTITLNCQDSSEATLSFIAMRDTKGNWPILEDSRFHTWKKVEIIVVFSDQETPLFSGYIREIKNNIGEQGKVATISLSCQDSFIAMDRQSINKNWEENRESLDIIKEIIRSYGIKLKSSVSSTPADNLQQNKTDYRFIREIANKNKYECYLRDKARGIKELYMGPAQTSATPSDQKIMIRAGHLTNCLSFDVSFDGYLPDSISTANTPKTGQEIEQSINSPQLSPLGTHAADSSASGLNPFEWTLPPCHSNNQEAAEAQAKGEAEKQAFKLKAIGRLNGTVYGVLLMPGTMVSVGGAGINNGKWYVDSTTHDFSSGGYFVDFELIRNASAGDENCKKHVLAGVL
ncbi:MAG: hypothetical protein JKY19_00800 [Alcanivoracaceae bacterium]|nr:hypothetical protein [Alcanivoracaceae bacterium]